MAWNDLADGSLRFPGVVFRRDRFYVYIAWGADRERPLYVGKGNKPFVRIGLHLGSAVWYEDVVEYECHAFLTVEDALEAEKEAIYELNPIHNVIRSQPRRVFEEKLLAVMERNEAQRKIADKERRRRSRRRAA